ncbi:hypothetical protein BGZ65_002967, partial [Modicella reniformis]
MIASNRLSYSSQGGKDFDNYTDSYPSKGLSSTAVHEAPETDSRNSWEENDSDGELYSADAYTYGREEDDEDDDDDDKHRGGRAHQINNGLLDTNGGDKHDQDSPPSLPNSVNSARSSHTKHHSFGYDKDRPEPSESDSESKSESDSDEETTFVNASSSPPGPPAPSALGSRPPSSSFSSNRTHSSRLSDPSTKLPEPEVKNETLLKQNPITSPSSSPPPPTLTRPAPIPSQQALSLASDPSQRRVSSSESDISSTSNDNRSQSIIGQVGSNRTFSSHRLSDGRNCQQRSTSSFSDLSDAELNEISLDSRPGTPKRNSGIMTPK